MPPTLRHSSSSDEGKLGIWWSVAAAFTTPRSMVMRCIWRDLHIYVRVVITRAIMFFSFIGTFAAIIPLTL